MQKNVIGQTGRVVLSDDAVWRKLTRKRTARYQYERVQCGWICWVCAPFHSPIYGANSFGTKRDRAKAALKEMLARNYRYFGHLLFSDVDDSDVIGLSPVELWQRSNNEQRAELRRANPAPIIPNDVVLV